MASTHGNATQEDRLTWKPGDLRPLPPGAPIPTPVIGPLDWENTPEGQALLAQAAAEADG
jgi:hypothetical protein